MQTVHDVRCPGCGAPAEIRARECKYCGRPVVISSFNSIKDWSAPQVSQYMRAYRDFDGESRTAELELAQGICLIKLGSYPLAMKHLESAISADIDNAEAYLYAAVGELAGKRPFLVPMGNVRRALAHLDTARMLEERGVFTYLSAYIREDFFKRKFLRISPSAEEEYALADAQGVSESDREFLRELIRIPPL